MGPRRRRRHAGDRARQLLCGWCALGLKLGAPWSPRGVLGWEIWRGSPDHVLLGAGGRIGLSGGLPFKREPEGMLFATFVIQLNPVARAAWTGSSHDTRRWCGRCWSTRPAEMLGAIRPAGSCIGREGRDERWRVGWKANNVAAYSPTRGGSDPVPGDHTLRPNGSSNGDLPVGLLTDVRM